MKNKRWKREAKRLKGECSNHFLCSRCKECDKCHRIIIPKQTFPIFPIMPEDMHIRDLEKMFKGAK